MYKYVERLPEPRGTNTGALHFGSYIHKILEEGYKATTVKELSDLAEEYKGNYKFNDDYIPKIDKCLKNFLRFNASLKDTLAVELVYEVVLDKRNDIKQNGVIDRVIKGDDGGLLVIDYKTSKREKSKIELYEDTQMKGYVFAVHKKYGVPLNNITAAHYYPITNNFVSVQYSSPQINSYKGKIMEEVWRIRKAKKIELHPSKNEFCNWCAYKELCPEFADSRLIEQKIQKIKEEKKLTS